MEDLKFKSKKQKKVFESIYKNVFFQNYSNNFNNDIIIDISHLENDEIKKIIELYGNNKNVIINTNKKKMAIL